MTTEFIWPIRVYYEDTDLAGVVYYANYLNYFERARTEWLRQLGFAQSVLKTEADLVFMVRQIQVEYRKPAYFDDCLTCTVQVSKVGRASLQLQQSVYRDMLVLCEAQLKLAAVKASTGRPGGFPPSLLQVLSQYESSA